MSQEEDEIIGWPDLDRKLFEVNDDSRRLAHWARTSTHVQIYLGYERAADLLYQQIEANRAGTLNLLQFPFIYLRRHEIELRMKELILIGRHFLDESGDIKYRHNLLNLWNELKRIDYATFEVDDRIGEAEFTERIEEFHRRDKEGTAFRYPCDAPNVNVEDDAIDIAAFDAAAKAMSSYLDCMREGWLHYLDC